MPWMEPKLYHVGTVQPAGSASIDSAEVEERRIMRRLILSSILCVFVAAPAFGDLMPVGGPVPTGSWTQEFLLTNVPATDTFDKVLIGLVTPANQRPWDVQNVFSPEDPDLIVRPTGGDYWWSVAEIRGTDMKSLSFTMHFGIEQDEPPGAVGFVLSVYDKLGCWLHSYDGAAIAISPDGIEWCIVDCGIDLQAVPVPGAVLLGALGLGTAGWRLRRFS